MTRMATTQADKDMIANWGKQSDLTVVRNSIADLLELDLRPFLSQIRTPLTLVYPDYVPLGAPRGAVDAQYRGAYKDVNHMTFVPITDSLHFIMLDQPNQFNLALDVFLSN
jgi:pimeloyl-ACP methyl ester carboxylesterase